jgi:hypothetical protein
MSFLPSFHFSPATRGPGASGPSAPPLMLCLDMRVHTPEDESGTGSSRGSLCGNTEDSEDEFTGSSRGSTPDDTDTEGTDTEGTRANTPDNAESLATSRSKGSFNWDREKGGFNLEWSNLIEFEVWRLAEELAYSIEFVKSESRTGGILWSRKTRYVCGRQETGGDRGYEKKHPERERKIGIRKTGCGCHIILKEYPHTSTVLGRYVPEHDHETGTRNIAYTRLSAATRERIKTMLTQKIARREIVSCRIHEKWFSCESNIFKGTRDSRSRAR